MEEEHGISRRGRLSDIDVCKKSGSITQSLYESLDGGEIFSWWLLVELVSFPGDASGKEPTCKCRRHTRCGFNPWARKSPWRMQWHSVFLLGESHGQRILVGYGSWGHKELDTTEVTSHGIWERSALGTEVLSTFGVTMEPLPLTMWTSSTPQMAPWYWMIWEQALTQEERLALWEE